MENQENKISNSESVTNAGKEQSFGKQIRVKKIYSGEEIINHFKELSKKLGRTPKVIDIKNEGKIKLSNIIKKFGTFVKAQLAAGLVPTRKGQAITHTPPRYSDKDLANNLKDVAKKLGRTPLMKEINDNGKIKFFHYFKRYRNWKDTLNAAGLVHAPSSKAHKEYSDEFLLSYLKELAKKIGKTPSISDIRKDGKIKFSSYFANFDGLDNAQKLAGLVPNKTGKQK